MEEKTGIETLFQIWASALKRVVETLSGAVLEVVCKPAETPALPAEELDSHLWWKQNFAGEPAFAVWFGAAEPTWSAVGAALGNQEESYEQTFLEMLGQAHRAAASALSSKAAKPIRCERGGREKPDKLSGLVISEVNITMGGKTFPPLIIAADPAAARALTGGAENTDSLSKSGREEERYTPMLQRLMDLELPLAVALGKAVLPIHDVLKLTAGSLIELDRSVGEYVDLMVHGTVVAKGEIVSVKGNYGVRIKEIISRQDRLALRGAA